MTTISFKDFSQGKPVQVVGNEQRVQEQETSAGPTFFQKLQDTASQTVSNIKDVANSDSNLPSKALQITGDVAQGGLNAMGNVISSTPVVKDVVSAVAKPISSGLDAVNKWISDNPQVQKAVSNETSNAIASFLDQHPDIARNAEAVNSIANAILVAKGTVETAVTAKNFATDIINKIPSGIQNVKDVLPQNLGQKAIDLVSADPEKKVQTILKESTPEELKNLTTIAEKASTDPRLPTPYEVTGQKLSDAVPVIQKKLQEIGQAKSDIIAPTREGLSPFVNETQPLIEKLTKLKNSFSEIDKGNSATVQAIIEDAKKISTKLDADKFIDKAQDALYTGNRNMTIVQGSAVDKQLRGIIGSYNNSLKSSLPKEYATLNEQYANTLENLSVINRSLGEVVDGVPLQGASLIKQFFSPSGTKAKEIFDFIKQQTDGKIDLAKDATLSKFSMELYDDPRARSLLEGNIPTSVSGVISKVIQKVGGEKLNTASKESTIRKAIKITSPK